MQPKPALMESSRSHTHRTRHHDGAVGVRLVRARLWASSQATTSAADSRGCGRRSRCASSGCERRLVGIGDAGELGDLAGPGLRVQALHVARLAVFERGRDVDLDEVVDPAAHLVAHRRGTARSRRSPRPRRCGRAATRRSRSAGCSCRGRPSRTRGPSTGARGPRRRRAARPCGPAPAARRPRSPRSCSCRPPKGR